ncbi:MAG: hypothetical protein SNJ84_02255 [Verrucomicrobiia bacterium]
MKSLDIKLQAIRSGSGAGEFILADARDADMAWGIASPGTGYPPVAGGGYQGMDAFMEQIRELVASDLLDIMLASTSTMSVLAHRENLFEDSPVTPAVRANDTTDVWVARGARYRSRPSRPFRTTTLAEAQYGSLTAPRTGKPKVNLGLYSITFNNDLEADLEALEAFRVFRQEAAEAGFDYFLEVFAPNVEDCGLKAEEVPGFVNDMLVRTLAGIARPHWPKFLKIPYFGPGPMEELCAYDSELVVGILGGGSGTTYDAFKLLDEAKKHGARVALYGRKIKDAEHPLTFVRHLRSLADGHLSPEEAVRSYHAELKKMGLPSRRSLDEDMALTAAEISYARS